MIQLGDRARDSITGYEGIVIARSEWLNGCVRFELQSEKLKDGVPHEPYWVDQQQIALVVSKAPKDVTAGKGESPPPGGPRSAPARANDPTF